MILLSPLTSLGSVHLLSCKIFCTPDGMIKFLKQVDGPYNKFSICPVAYSISVIGGIKEMDNEWHKKYVYPYTYNTRKREVNAGNM